MAKIKFLRTENRKRGNLKICGSDSYSLLLTIDFGLGNALLIRAQKLTSDTIVLQAEKSSYTEYYSEKQAITSGTELYRVGYTE